MLDDPTANEDARRDVSPPAPELAWARRGAPAAPAPAHAPPAAAALGTAAARRARRAHLVRAGLRRRGLAVAQVLLLWVLTWPTASMSSFPGLDPSYRFALQQAYVEGRRFGREIVFTYGPLGFLSFPELHHWQPAMLSLAARSAFMLLACAFVLWAIRGVVRRRVAAFLAAYGVVALTLTNLLRRGYLAEATCALLVAVALAALLSARELRRPERAGLLVVLGATAALLGLVKTNTGATALLVGALTAVGLTRGPGWQARARLADVGTFAAAAAVAFLAGWAFAGQDLGDIPAYLRGSRELTSGYSSAMSVEGGDNRWEYAAALVLVGANLAALVAAGRQAARRRAQPAAWALLPVALYGAAFFALFKHGFVRHDTHSYVFFVAVAVMALGALRPGLATAVAGVVAVSLVASWSIVDDDVVATLDPRDRIEALRHQAYIARSAAARQEIRDESRARLAEAYGLDERTLEHLRGARVHVDPWETSVLFAHPEAEWAPVPVFQSYGAYTAELDRRNADALADVEGPDVVLREAAAIDGRSPAFESPAYLLAMVCNFTEVHAQERWFVLRRTADRCGEPRVVTEASAPAGTPVALPAPDACPGVLTMRVRGLVGSRAERLVDLLYKGNQYSLEVGGGYYRFVPLTAAQPHVLWAPDDPAWLGGAHPFRGAERLTVRPVPSADLFATVGRADELRYTFECVPLGPVG